MSLRSEFAARLKEIRKKRGLTQEQLAELAGVASRHISFIETARSFPSSDLIEKFAAVLNTSCASFFEFEKEISREEILSELLKIAKSLNDEKLNFLYKMAKNL